MLEQNVDLKILVKQSGKQFHGVYFKGCTPKCLKIYKQ